jgi:YVTN family beta-propeller protein
VGTTPFGIAITPDGAFAYVINRSINTVSVIDTSNNTVASTLNLGFQSTPIGVAITPDGAFAYVTNGGNNTVSVIDTSNNMVVASVPVGEGPQDLSITPDGAFAYVANNVDHTVSVINTTTNTNVATIPVGNGPIGVALTPDGALAYVTNSQDDTVTVIDTATNTPLAPIIAVGDTPISYSMFIGPDVTSPTFEELIQDVLDSDLGKFRKGYLMVLLIKADLLLENNEPPSFKHHLGCRKLSKFNNTVAFYAQRGFITQEVADDWTSQANSLKDQNDCASSPYQH